MKLNLSKLIDSTKNVWKRFPMCLVFLAALTVQMIYYIVIEKHLDALTFFFSVGMLVSLLLHLCSKKINWLWIIPYLLLAADSYGLHMQDGITDAVGIAQFTAVLALSVAVSFLPFRKEKNDLKSWNFVFSVVFNAGLAMLLGIVMCAGLCLLYYGSAELFGFLSNSKVAEVLGVLCLVTLPTVLFLSLVHVPTNDEGSNVDGFLLGVVRYLFLPLAILYMIVLYAYGVQILVTSTLPKGMLSTLISTLMIVIILVTFLIYPRLQNKENKDWETKVIRWLPLFVIPLIILMSVGIGRRFMDYGITPRRLYLLTLNVWFYIVAIGLCICRARRIHWISISFTLLLIASSCHPWNYNSLYRNMLIDDFDKMVAKYPFKSKSLTDEMLRERLLTMPDSDARKLYATMQAMSEYDYTLAHRKFGDDARISSYGESYDHYMRKYDVPNAGNDDAITYCECRYQYNGRDIPVPANYKYMNVVSEKDMLVPIKNCTDSTLTFSCNDFGKATVNHKKLNNNQLYTCQIKNKDALLVITKLSTDDVRNHNIPLTFEGVIYYNKRN